MLNVTMEANGIDTSNLDTITGREGAAISIDAREATAEEIVATNALQDEKAKVADTLQTLASKAAVKSLGESDSHTFDAVVSLALNLCAEQIRSLLTEGLTEESKDLYVFKRDILLPAAKAGHMIYRGTETEIADVLAKPANSKARTTEATAYVNMKGQKYVEGISKLRTHGFRLAKFFRDVHGQADGNGSVIVEAAKMSGEIGCKAAAEFFRNKVIAEFGDSYAKLSSKLDVRAKAERRAASFKGGAVATVSPEEQAKVDAQNERDAETARDQRDPVGAIMRSVVNLTDEQFQSLMFRLRGEAEDRTARHTAPATDASVTEGEVVAEPLRIAA